MSYQPQPPEKNPKISTLPGVFAKNDIDFCTKFLLREVKTKKDDILCDLGAGTGIVGIWHSPSVKSVTFIESNLRAFKVCQKNIKENNIKNSEAFLSDIFIEFDKEGPKTKFTLILTNPPVSGGKWLTREFIQGAYDHLKPGGRFYLACRTNLPYDKYTREIFGNRNVVHRNPRAKLIEAIKE